MTGTGMYRVQKQETFGQFLWNSETKQFLGRTGTSWCKIGVFYVIFYSCLAAFFAAMFAVFYTTLDTEHMPKYIPGDGGSILKNPAMGYRPSPKANNIESTLIWYKNGDKESISHWVKSLNDFVKGYSGDALAKWQKENAKKSAEEQDPKPIECSDEKRPKDNEYCSFSDSLFTGNCSTAEEWGYSSNSPCIILKLNKMIGWIPDVYQSIDELSKDMPESLKNHITEETIANGNVMPKRIWVSCDGENPSDEEYLGTLNYSPWQGFPDYYFPFTNQKGYMAPIVAVEFQSTKPNVLINIECRAWAKNIKYDRGNRFGLVSFQILRD